MKNWIESVYSDGTRYYVSNPYPKVNEEISIKIRMYVNQQVKAVFLRTFEDGDEKIIPMEYDREENDLIYRVCRLTVYEKITKYRFIIATDTEIYYYNQYEISKEFPDSAYDFKILADVDELKWVKEGVFYQIFPDRFCNGDKSIGVGDGEYEFDGYKTIKVDDFNKVPSRYEEVHCLDFYNGDLDGIKEKIPYLKELGVTSIYINPIFKANTVHKYDCTDYFEVDEHLGGNKALIDLVEELHKNDMKLVVDVSINHTGINADWFKDKKEFYFTNNDEYAAWKGVKTLPLLNYTNEELQDIIYKGEDCLVEKWVKPPYNIDGWRFDVADNVGRYKDVRMNHTIWRTVNKKVKSINSKAYIIGECWEESDEYLKGDMWDSAMNYYGFSRPVRMFVGEQDIHGRDHALLKSIKEKMTAKELKDRILMHLAKLPSAIIYNQFNLIDSHDVHRLHNNPDISFNDYKAAVIMLFTMPGTPSIYYGDELGIDGRTDDMEGCRYPMPWDRVEEKEDNKYYKLYSKLAYYKNKVDALKYGGFKILWSDDYVFSYARFTNDELWISVCSTDDSEREITIPLKAFGKSHFMCQIDALDEKISYVVKDSEFILKVPAHTSYLLGL